MAKPITKEWFQRNLKKFDVEVAERKYLYKIKKLEEAEEGYISSYKLIREQDGEEVAIGDVINIPKDYLVKKAEVKVCEEDDKPVEGYKTGDKYLDFTINTKDGEGSGDESHLYILFRELVDLREGEGITVKEGGIIGVNYASDLRIGTEEDGEDKGKLTLNYEEEDIDFSNWDKNTSDPIVPDPIVPDSTAISMNCETEGIICDLENKTITISDELIESLTGKEINVELGAGDKTLTLNMTIGSSYFQTTLENFTKDDLPKELYGGWVINSVEGDMSVLDKIFA